MDAQPGMVMIFNIQWKGMVYKSPVPHDTDVTTTSALAKFLFRDGFQTCAINKRLSEFNTLRRIGLFSLDVKPEIAEAKVNELINIYLHIQRNSGRHEESIWLLKIAIEICIQYKLPNGAYVRYAVYALKLHATKCISIETSDISKQYNMNHMLDEFTQYRTATDTQHVQYFLHQIRNIRVLHVATFKYRHYQYHATLLANEPKQAELPTTKILPFIDLPYVPHVSTSPHVVSRLQTALSTVTQTVGASPDVVLLMLRYGATPRHVVSDKFVSTITPGDFVSRHITQLLKEKFMGEPIRETFVAVIENVQIQNLFKMLQFMLRADTHLILTYISMYNWNDGLNDHGYRHIQPSTLRAAARKNKRTIDSRLRDHFLPTCLTESVPSLLRLSRYVIRGVLLQNRQLPDGIKLLQIPELLKPYLDLLED